MAKRLADQWLKHLKVSKIWAGHYNQPTSQTWADKLGLLPWKLYAVFTL